MGLCECGCKELAKRRFIDGHNRRGTPSWNKGLKGYSNQGSFSKRFIPWNKGHRKIIILSECECGCKELTKRRFIDGHQRRTQKFFERSKQIQHVCLCGCGQTTAKTYNKYIVGHNQRGKVPSNKGKKMPFKGVPHSKEHNRKVGEANKVALKAYYANTPGAKEKNSENVKRSWRENPEKFRNSVAAFQKYGELRKLKLVPSGAVGMKHTQEWKEKRSEEMKELWKDLEYSKKVMSRRDKSIPEQIFEDLVVSENLPYKFVGNGIFKIGRMNPDFIHTGTEKKVIEIYGDFFHKNHNPQDRIDKMKQHGYLCLVLWASELSDKQNVLNKIQEM